MYGDIKKPNPENMQMFAEAFELSEEEKIKLAWAYTYSRKLIEGEL